MKTKVKGYKRENNLFFDKTRKLPSSMYFTTHSFNYSEKSALDTFSFLETCTFRRLTQRLKVKEGKLCKIITSRSYHIGVISPKCNHSAKTFKSAEGDQVLPIGAQGSGYTHTQKKKR